MTSDPVAPAGDVGYQFPDGPKLNLGCGTVQPPGWVNIDASHRAWLAARLPHLDRLLIRLGLLPKTEFGPQVKIHNLNKPLPYGDDTVACIYGGEVWEHFEYPDAVRLTFECYRVLAPGGILRVSVPDGAEFWRRYLEMYKEALAQPSDRRRAEPLRKHVHAYFDSICTRKIYLRSMMHKHKWQFDEVQLVELFQEAGFCQVRRMSHHHSRVPDIAEVEHSDSGKLIVEGSKPRATPPAV